MKQECINIILIIYLQCIISYQYQIIQFYFTEQLEYKSNIFVFIFIIEVTTASIIIIIIIIIIVVVNNNNIINNYLIILLLLIRCGSSNTSFNVIWGAGNDSRGPGLYYYQI